MPCFLTPALRLVALLSAAVTLTACASSTTNLQMKTAQEVEGSAPTDFRIVEVDRKATSVTWTAEDTRTGDRYTGFGDDMLRDVTVRPVATAK